MTTRERFLALVCASIGPVALPLPFSAGISPLEALFLDPLIAMLGAPMLLAIPITVWVLRRMLAHPAGRVEIAMAYVFSVAAMAIPMSLGIYAELVDSPGLWSREALGLAACWILALGNWALLASCRRRQSDPWLTAEIFLLAAYLPNAAFCLILFFPGDVFSGWDAGAYVVLVSSLVYANRAATLLSQLKRRGQPPALGAEPPPAAP